jgi:hypothetical protein
MSEGQQPPPVRLSKSVFLLGLQCPKLLWHSVNTKDLLPEPDAAQQAIFNQGEEVGSLAKQTFPGGIEMANGVGSVSEIATLTQQALHLRKPLFEPAFEASGGLCRVDVLNPAADEGWELVEIKSSTSVKQVNIQDVAFQEFVLSESGLPVKRAKLMYLNSQYVRLGAVEPEKLFASTDLTAQVGEVSPNITQKVSEMLAVIRQSKPPEVKIGPHCDSPYTCPLHDQCWKFLPDQNVTSLYRGRKKGFKLLASGVTELRDIPDTVKLTAKQKIQKQCAETGEPHVNKTAIVAFLKRLRYPVHFLDFETVNPAVPLFDGVRPYQQVPFQFSLHILNAPDVQPEHRSFLAEGGGDPRPEFMGRLRKSIRDSGSIVVFNGVFEKSRLRECGDFLPQHMDWVRGVVRRFADLLQPFRAFHYYHPGQCGSASIKSVLPALTGSGYGHLGIQDGTTASLEFLRVTFGEVPEGESQRVRRQLEEYCALDTQAMILILAELERLVRA